MIGPSETRKTQLIQYWHKIGAFDPKIDKFHFFYQGSQPSYFHLQKEIENVDFFQGVNFEFTDSLENNGTRYLLIFDDSCKELCNSKAFVDIATAGKRRGLSTSHIKHNLFHQSNLGEKFSSRSRKLFPSNLGVMWCKSVLLVHKWHSDQS